MTRVLLADDDGSLRNAIGKIIRNAGYDCIECENGLQAIDQAVSQSPDVIVLDVMMPLLDGFEACERIRKAGVQAPILILSAKSDIVDKKTGFRLGADDYLAKPFDEEELLIRIEALLRRGRLAESETKAPAPTRIVVGKVDIDAPKLRVTVDGEDARLTLTEFKILFELASHLGDVVTNEEIIRTVWGEAYANDPINLPVYIRRLRTKIEKDPSDPQYIKTIYRLGYKMEQPKD